MSEGSSSLTEVLDLLRKHGERLDSEIAEEMGIPLETVRQQLSWPSCHRASRHVQLDSLQGTVSASTDGYIGYRASSRLQRTDESPSRSVSLANPVEPFPGRPIAWSR
jgi:hypothetical protein